MCDVYILCNNDIPVTGCDFGMIFSLKSENSFMMSL